jgi:hypothetical protein
MSPAPDYRIREPWGDDDPWGHPIVKLSYGWVESLAEVIRARDLQHFELVACDETVLEQLSKVAKVRILGLAYGDRIRDLSLLSRFRWLQSLTLGEGCTVPTFSSVDFSALPELRYLDCDLKAAESLRGATSLRELQIGCKAKDLEVFDSLSNLEVLRVSAPLESLSGVGRLPQLRELCLIQNRLETLAGIESAAASLRYVRLSEMKRLHRIDALAALTRLEKLEFDDKMPLRDFSPIGHLTALEWLDIAIGGSIPNVAFLAPLKQLRYCMLGTVIEDGDLSVLLTLPKLVFLSTPERPHYSPDVLSALSEQRIPLWKKRR